LSAIAAGKQLQMRNSGNDSRCRASIADYLGGILQGYLKKATVILTRQKCQVRSREEQSIRIGDPAIEKWQSGNRACLLSIVVIQTR
jgi:hypothetical protein